jgi:hypothetical protein
MIDLKPGARARSVVCDAEFVVVRPARTASRLECGGQPVVPLGSPVPEGVATIFAEGSAATMGKRYVDEASGLEVLCSKSGRGVLSVDGRPMAMRDAKKLPASD